MCLSRGPFKSLVDKPDLHSRSTGSPCRDRVHSKQTRSPFHSSLSYRAQRPLELIHGDFLGPIVPKTLRGSRYFRLLVDHCKRLMWVSFMKLKFEAFEAFRKFKALAESEKGLKIGCLRTDEGGEFNSKEFYDFCSKEGVYTLLTTAKQHCRKKE